MALKASFYANGFDVSTSLVSKVLVPTREVSQEYLGLWCNQQIFTNSSKLGVHMSINGKKSCESPYFEVSIYYTCKLWLNENTPMLKPNVPVTWTQTWNAALTNFFLYLCMCIPLWDILLTNKKKISTKKQ